MVEEEIVPSEHGHGHSVGVKGVDTKHGEKRGVNAEVTGEKRALEDDVIGHDGEDHVNRRRFYSTLMHAVVDQTRIYQTLHLGQWHASTRGRGPE